MAKKLHSEMLYLLETTVAECMHGRPWRETPFAAFACPSCGNPRVDAYPQPLPVETVYRQRSSIDLATQAAVIARGRLVDVLRSYNPGIVPGPVTMIDGRLQPDSFSLHFPQHSEIRVRGGVGSSRRKFGYSWCTTCSRAEAVIGCLVAPLHVLRREIPCGKVYVEGHSFVIVTEEVRRDDRLSEFKDLRFVSLPIFDESLEHVPMFDDSH